MGFGEWMDCTKSQVQRQETARPCSQWKEYITTLGETKRCSSTKTESGLQRSWKMLDFHFVLFVLFGRRQERDLFQGPKYEAGTNRQGRWMRETSKIKQSFAQILMRFWIKYLIQFSLAHPPPNLSSLEDKLLNFTPSSLPDQIKRISQVLMDCGVKR